MSRFALIAEKIWDGTSDRAKPNAAVLVNEQVVEAVCAVSEIPSGVERIDCSHCTILPGLIDAHVHYSSPMGPAFLGAGVTTIRDVGNDLEWILQQRAAHAKDVTLGPGIVCCGQLLDGSPAIWTRMGRPHADEKALRASVRQEVEKGVDQIKLYARLDLPLLSAGVDEAHRNKKWALAHLGSINAEDAARAGLNEIQHLTGCGPAWAASTPAERDALIDILLKHEVVMTPTLVVWDRFGRILDHAFDFDIRRRWLHPCHRQIWDSFSWRFDAPETRFRYQAAMPHLKRCLAQMQSRSLTVALGTDTPFPHLIPGFSVHDELAMYVDAGIKPIDALRSATSVNARVIGLGSRIGKIAPGFQADLVAVEGDPLQRIQDIANVQCVVRAGRVFRLQELHKLARSYQETDPSDPVTLDLQTRRAER
jgi:imidazolonepropionase-like amidohydrolase